MKEDKIIMFPKSPARLAEEWKTTATELDDEYAKLWREHELLKAALQDDNGEALAKVACDQNEVTFAKIQLDRLSSDKRSLFYHTGNRLITWLNEWNKCHHEHTVAKKRAERFFGGRR